jgi:hypothetical protein
MTSQYDYFTIATKVEGAAGSCGYGDKTFRPPPKAEFPEQLSDYRFFK